MTGSEIIQWLSDTGRHMDDPCRFVEVLADLFNRNGLPVDRLTTGVPQLHPQIVSISAAWKRETGAVLSRWKGTDDVQNRVRNSPLYQVYYEGKTGDYDLSLPPQPDEFPIITELRDEGFTHYLALPLKFSDGTWKGLSLATRRPGGFSDQDMHLINEVLPVVGMAMEIQTQRSTARTLLDTYVGAHAGKRVLDGAIKRGDVETIRAVIWYSDLRDFTSFSNKHETAAVLAHLNDYFSALTEAINAHSGEVLKYIGDAVLAIFPEDGNEADMAQQALKAARQALDTMQHAPQKFSIALHLGEVSYGNIGAEERLDFTVIGPAVNLAARIEGQCTPLAQPLLLSKAMADALGKGRLLGKFQLKGFDSEQEIYAPA